MPSFDFAQIWIECWCCCRRRLVHILLGDRIFASIAIRTDCAREMKWKKTYIGNKFLSIQWYPFVSCIDSYSIGMEEKNKNCCIYWRCEPWFGLTENINETLIFIFFSPKFKSSDQCCSRILISSSQVSDEWWVEEYDGIQLACPHCIQTKLPLYQQWLQGLKVSKLNHH